jgi:hypothetical protein
VETVKEWYFYCMSPNYSWCRSESTLDSNHWSSCTFRGYPGTKRAASYHSLAQNPPLWCSLVASFSLKFGYLSKSCCLLDCPYVSIHQIRRRMIFLHHYHFAWNCSNSNICYSLGTFSVFPMYLSSKKSFFKANKLNLQFH